MRFKPLNAMLGGFIVAAIGVGFAFYTLNPWCVILGIFIFAIGEMSSSPKITEYIGGIAPKDKVALYMGTSFLPVAAGNYFAGKLSGGVYEDLSDKISLLQREVAQRGLDIPEITKEFTQNDYVAMACEKMGMSNSELTQFLWNTYEPSQIWVIFTGIGLFAVVALFLYDKFVMKGKDAVVKA